MVDGLNAGGSDNRGRPDRGPGLGSRETSGCRQADTRMRGRNGGWLQNGAHDRWSTNTFQTPCLLRVRVEGHVDALATPHRQEPTNTGDVAEVVPIADQANVASPIRTVGQVVGSVELPLKCREMAVSDRLLDPADYQLGTEGVQPFATHPADLGRCEPSAVVGAHERAVEGVQKGSFVKAIGEPRIRNLTLSSRGLSKVVKASRPSRRVGEFDNVWHLPSVAGRADSRTPL